MHARTCTHTHTHTQYTHHLLTHSFSHTRLKDLGFPKDHAPLYLIVDKAVVEGALTLKEVYETRQHKGDKYLHIAYSSTEPEKS